MKLYFTLAELNPYGHPLSPDVGKNLVFLIERLSIFRESYGIPMIPTNGYRTPEEHRILYANKPRIPWGSLHLIGCAADIWDRDRRLAAFAIANIPLLEVAGLWCEDPSYTHSWVHFQTKPPASGNRFFKPGV
jgi:hypothetical protein